MDNKKNPPIFLVSNISFGESSHIFNKKKVKKNYTLLLGKEQNNNYLVLRENHRTLLILDQQGFIQENENLIFQFSIRGNKVELINLSDKCEIPTSYEKVFGKINKLNFKLWKSLPKCPKCDITKSNNSIMEEDYIYKLEQNNIFRLAEVKFILREFHHFPKENENDNLNNCNDCNNIKGPFSIELKPYQGELCDICYKRDVKDDYLLKFCDCEKYRHIKCMKKKLKEIIFKDEYKNGCIRYYIKTNCFSCRKFIPLSFYIRIKDDYVLYELVDIPRDNNREYLLIETLDFLNLNGNYVKYIYYINLREKGKDKNIDTILIGSNRRKNNDYQYNKLIEIDHGTISSQHAIMDYDIEEKSLSLRNISDKQNTLVLQDKFELESEKNKLLMELGNIQIESHIITNKKEYNKIKDESQNFFDPIIFTRNSDTDDVQEYYY